jgi:sec-independent protein translocase protein TatB
MFNLDPGKLLVIAVVAIILLGPDRLPQVARQVGGAWRSFNEFRHRMESEVRSSMPDLPPTSEIARLARSPSALLNHLSNMSSDEDDEEPDGSFSPPTSTNGAAAPDANGPAASGAQAGSNGVAGEGAAGDSDEGGRATPTPTSAPTPTTNGAGRPEAATAPAADPLATAPTWSPPAAAAPEVIVPGDPTLN